MKMSESLDKCLARTECDLWSKAGAVVSDVMLADTSPVCLPPSPLSTRVTGLGSCFTPPPPSSLTAGGGGRERGGGGGYHTTAQPAGGGSLHSEKKCG